MLSRRSPGTFLAVAVAIVLMAAGGCSKGTSSSTGKTPQQVVQAAQQKLDSTTGVQLSLSTTDLPASVQGILSGTGIGTHAPAFDGSIKVQTHGISVDVPVIAVGGKVYAQTPFTTKMAPINPADYGAPDPAKLFGAGTGISSLLTSTQDLKAGSTVRGGPDNSEILTEYTGTLPASFVTRVIPSATGGSFTVSYQIADNGELRTAVLTGEFYPGAGNVTYTLTLTNYGTTKDIKAP